MATIPLGSSHSLGLHPRRACHYLEECPDLLAHHVGLVEYLDEAMIYRRICTDVVLSWMTVKGNA